MQEFAHNALFYTLPFLVVLTLVITVHEFGHFIVARWCGVAVDRFSIGFGRAIVSWKTRGGMEWRLGWIPLGGYVRFSGDESVASVPDDEDLKDLRREVLAKEGPEALKRYFHFKPLWQRALVVAAGPAANFVLAIAIFAAFALAAGEVTLIKPRVAEVVAGSPAAKAGFQAGDLITRANGWGIRDFKELQRFVLMRSGQPIRFEVDRHGEPVSLTAVPAQLKMDGPGGSTMKAGYLGIAASQAAADRFKFRYNVLTAAGQGGRQTVEIVDTTLNYIKRIFTGRESGDQFSGPLGIAGVTGAAATEATKDAATFSSGTSHLAMALLNVAAFISVAVGFANLLPIPVLDGGHLLFYAYEAVARRPLAASVQAAGYRVGFALLIGLMLFVTWNDLQRYRVFHLIGGLFS